MTKGVRSIVRTLAAMLPILAALIGVCSAAFQGQLQAFMGKPAPFFSILSSDDENLVPDMFKGKVAVIFYETREASKKNGDIKDRFNQLYERQEERVRRSIVRIPVFNCSRVIWPVTLVWKSALKSNAKRVGMTLYGDWDGRMAKDYRMADDESNCIIIDKKGIVRYTSVGRITDRQFQEIEELLDTLVNREE